MSLIHTDQSWKSKKTQRFAEEDLKPEELTNSAFQAELKRLLVEWNDTAAGYPCDSCIHELFEAQVMKTPDALAIIHQGQQLTYAELNRKSNQLAQLLMAQGIGPDKLAGISMARSNDVIISVLGILKAGGACVPLDPDYPQDRLSFMLADAAISVLLTQERIRAELPLAADNIVCIDSLLNTNSASVIENPPHLAKPHNLSYVIYTSGSTGMPKGVALTHRTLTNLITWQQSNMRINPDDRVLQFAPTSFDVFFQEVFYTLCSGGALVIPSEELRRDPVGLLLFLGEHKISHLFLPFVALQGLAEASAAGAVPALREVITAGEQLRITPQIVSFFENLPRCRLHNHYGPSETHVVTSFTLTGSPASWPMLPSIGRPIANTQVYILDQHLQPVPIGISGELYIGGDSLARGYLNKKELTDEKFVSDPFSGNPNARLYKTGDVVRHTSAGTIDFLGRSDTQVKIRGYRIELGEIEAALSNIKGIQQAAVVMRQDARGMNRLVAYVVMSHGTIFAAGEIRRLLRETLPEYMTPAAFVSLESLPLTSSGKINRRALPEPATEQREIASAPVQPRDPVELQLTKLWEETLGIRPIGVKDNFFDLGANSLLAARLFTRVSKKFGKHIPPSSLFEAPTIEQQARLIFQQAKISEWSSLVAVQPHGTNAPLFCIHGGAGTIFFANILARHLGNDQPVYAFQVQGLYDVAPPHKTVEEMAAHYIKEMHTVQPEGPYSLAGYCFGAIIAFEMSRQLEKERQKVVFLASIDGPSPFYKPPSSNAKVAVHLRQHLEAIQGLPNQHKWNQIIKVLIKESRDFAGLIYRSSKLRRVISKLRMEYHRSRQHYRPLPERVRKRFFLYNNGLAEKMYHPIPYTGSMAIFCFRSTSVDPWLGWGNLIKGGIEVFDIPATNNNDADIVEGEAAQVLCRQIQACLRTAPVSQPGHP
jgi:amino acid adenylation domain-containing protein